MAPESATLGGIAMFSHLKLKPILPYVAQQPPKGSRQMLAPA
jgi:hypothetical protein